MHLSALFVACEPSAQPMIKQSLDSMSWAEIQLEESGKLIVTIEAENETQAGHRVQEIEEIGGVIAAQVTAFHSSTNEEFLSQKEEL